MSSSLELVTLFVLNGSGFKVVLCVEGRPMSLVYHEGQR
jgi:hypothetical protein